MTCDVARITTKLNNIELRCDLKGCLRSRGIHRSPSRTDPGLSRAGRIVVPPHRRSWQAPKEANLFRGWTARGLCPAVGESFALFQKEALTLCHAKVELSLASAGALAFEVCCSFANVSTTLATRSIDEAITSLGTVFTFCWTSVENVASQEAVLFRLFFFVVVCYFLVASKCCYYMIFCNGTKVNGGPNSSIVFPSMWDWTSFFTKVRCCLTNEEER